MKAKVTNVSRAPQGVWTVDGLRFIDPGKSRTVEIHEDHVEATKRLTELLSVEPVKAGPLDRDESGEDGGSLPYVPPALSGKNKAELLEIAAAEGVEIEDGATNDDIKSAIELNREDAE